MLVSRRRRKKSRNWQITDDLLASQFERFTNKVELNFKYSSKIYCTKPTEWRFRVLDCRELILGKATFYEKLLSFYKEIVDTQHFPFYIILSNYVWSILFYQDKDYNVRQIRFHVCIKMRCCKRRVCKRRVCKRKTLFGQPNTLGLAPMEKVSSEVSPGPRSEMTMLLLFSDTGTISTLLLWWPAGCSLDPLGFYDSVPFASLLHLVSWYDSKRFSRFNSSWNWIFRYVTGLHVTGVHVDTIISVRELLKVFLTVGISSPSYANLWVSST